jgi:glycogen debranching enzyme
MERYADHDGDGYLDYAGKYETGLINQGWKDAGNAIINADGSLASPPIALCEVQAYAYRAWRQVARLLQVLGDADKAADLDRRATEMQIRFDGHFWSEELGCYLLALQKDARPAAVVTSNAGQVLWGGIASRERAALVAERLMQPDMFSGWGIRTLSSRAAVYNPMSYHTGSVWPHDNALIVEGLKRYGHDHAALRVFDALFEAASNFRDYRMPELYCGFDREEEHAPVRYPVACSPQAWASAAIPHALWQLLGLRPEALEGRLAITRPCLPDWLDWLEVRNMQVGTARVDLRFQRTGVGTLQVQPSVREGTLSVEQVVDEVAPDVF